VWRWPLVLAALTAVGLTSALLADGLYDAVSWLTLGVVELVPLRLLLAPVSGDDAQC